MNTTDNTKAIETLTKQFNKSLTSYKVSAYKAKENLHPAMQQALALAKLGELGAIAALHTVIRDTLGETVASHFVSWAVEFSNLKLEEGIWKAKAKSWPELELIPFHAWVKVKAKRAKSVQSDVEQQAKLIKAATAVNPLMAQAIEDIAKHGTFTKSERVRELESEENKAINKGKELAGKEIKTLKASLQKAQDKVAGAATELTSLKVEREKDRKRAEKAEATLARAQAEIERLVRENHALAAKLAEAEKIAMAA